MKVPIYQVDAFANCAFCGNPAGVCILQEPKSSKWMQHVAAEMNSSETAFLVKQDKGYSLRWFSPVTEVNLCGHATLAAAHVLREMGALKPGENVVFNTLSGALTAKLEDDFIELCLPSDKTEEVKVPDGLLEALGMVNSPEETKVLFTGINNLSYLVEVASDDLVIKAKPDFKMIKESTDRGVIITSLSSRKEYDFVSRYFDPCIGLNEDPVTGAAHCCLGPYWSKKLGKTEFKAYQASKRGGNLKVRVEKNKTYVSGQAVTVIRGMFEA